MRYVIKKSEKPLKSLKLKDVTKLTKEMLDCQTSEEVNDMSEIDDIRENELFVEEISATDVSCFQEKEIWQTCCYNDEIFEDYEVSNLGRVRSYKRSKTPRLLKPGADRDGYLQVILCKDGKRYNCKLHRLVICSHQAIPENFDKLDVNHIDENKTNNCIANLEWLTRKDNLNHGSRNKRAAKALSNGKLSKKVYQFTKSGKFVKKWISSREAARQLNIDQGGISMCCLGKCKTYKNYKWSYSETLD